MAGTNYPSQRPTFLQNPAGDPRLENRAPDAGLYPGQIGTQFPFRDPSDLDQSQMGFQVVTLDSVMDVLPTPGAVAWWRNATGYVVTTDVSVAGRGNPAGILGFTAVQADLDAGNICCVQQKGPALVQVGTGTPSNVGLFVIPTATDAKAEWLAAGNAATYPPLGTSAGPASGGLALVQLNLEGRP